MKKLLFTVAILVLASSQAYASNLSKYEGTWVSKDAEAKKRIEISIQKTQDGDVLKLVGFYRDFEVYPNLEVLSRGTVQREWLELNFTSAEKNGDLIITSLMEVESNGLILPGVLLLRRTGKDALEIQLTTLTLAGSSGSGSRLEAGVDILSLTREK